MRPLALLFRAAGTPAGVLEAVLEAPALPAADNYLGVIVRRQGNGDGYYVAILPSSKLGLLKSVSSVVSILATGTGNQGFQVMPKIGRIRVQITAGRIRAWLDGEQQLDYTDAANPLVSGEAIGVVGRQTVGRARTLHLRKGDTVTVNGLTAGDKITLRTPGGLPYAVKTATGTSVTFGPADGVEHSPAGGIDVNGSAAYTDLLWGGDVFVRN